MRRFWQFALVAWTAIWALIVVGVQTPADTGISNLATWARALGLIRLAYALAPSSTNSLIFLFACFGNAATFVFWIYAPLIFGSQPADFHPARWQIILSWLCAGGVITVGVVSYFFSPLP